MTALNQPSDSSNKVKILVVDDLPENLRLLKEILLDQDYEVRFASSGKLALLSLAHFRPDLILLDIMMPGINGIEVCQKLRANPETKYIPVLFLSAVHDTVRKVKAFEIGGDDYITKPFATAEVLARIRYQISLQDLRQQLQQKNQELIEQNERLQQAQQGTLLLLEVTQAIETSLTPQEAINTVLDMICQNRVWDYGECWQPNGDRGVLECITKLVPSDQPSPALQTFWQRSDRMTFTIAEGLPGQIWQSHQAEWIDDLSRYSETIDHLQTQWAIDAGLKAVLGLPILAENDILAVIVFYKTEITPCNPHTFKLLQAIATQLSFPLQQAQLKQKLEQLARVDRADLEIHNF